MSVTKKYLKTKSICKVTFRLPKEAAASAKSVHLVGEFNDWDAEATPMQRLKNGSFKVMVDLEKDNEYQYRYLLEGCTWENDWDADKYVPSEFSGIENSVVVV